MKVTTVDCLEHRQWQDKEAQHDAIHGHEPHVFIMGWRKRAYRCRGSKRIWDTADLSVLIVRWLRNPNISIKAMLQS